MSRSTRLVLASVGLFVLSAGPLAARIAAPPALPERLARAEVVVTGKITRFEEKNVTAKDGMEYQIAVVKIDGTILGAKGLTHLRLALPPGGGIRVGRGFMKISEGLEACFFLRPVAGESFYTAPMYYDIMPRASENFKQDVELLTRCAKLLEDPSAGLTSSDPAARFLTAAVLIARYRTPPPSAGELAQEPIDLKESKLLLLALADADWEKADPRFSNIQPLSLFLRLGVTPQDGFNRPANFKDLPTESKKWLRANAETYRIKKFVAKK
jgi:hypothetical protein